jgi:hypothetical protein
MCMAIMHTVMHCNACRILLAHMCEQESPMKSNFHNILKFGRAPICHGTAALALYWDDKISLNKHVMNKLYLGKVSSEAKGYCI